VLSLHDRRCTRSPLLPQVCGVFHGVPHLCCHLHGTAGAAVAHPVRLEANPLSGGVASVVVLGSARVAVATVNRCADTVGCSAARIIFTEGTVALAVGVGNPVLVGQVHRRSRPNSTELTEIKSSLPTASCRHGRISERSSRNVQEHIKHMQVHTSVDLESRARTLTLSQIPPHTLHS
jgi:hypothetical protein